MAYKDKDKQREAVRQATRRYRAKLKGITNHPQTVIPLDDVIPEHVIPCDTQPVIPKKQDIKCYDDLPDHVKRAVGPMPPDTHARRLPKPQSYNSMMVGYVPPKEQGND